MLIIVKVLIILTFYICLGKMEQKQKKLKVFLNIQSPMEEKQKHEQYRY